MGGVNMKRGNIKKLVVFFTLAAFIISNCSAIVLAAPSAAVVSYCTRSVTPVVSINVAGEDDVTADGVNYKRQSSVGGFTAVIKEPEKSVFPAGVQLNAFSKIEVKTYIEITGSIESCRIQEAANYCLYREW
jgi:hypothetical protein